MDGILHFLKNPQWRHQHRWRRLLWHTMVRLGMTGMHGLPLNRRWVEIHRRKMPLKGLDPSLTGLRIVQISDLHYSPVVWEPYLLQFVEWVNALKPDLIVVTGDLITGGYRYAHRVATILSHLKAPRGVICTFGNHDYSIYGRFANGEGERRADYLEQCLQKRGMVVLRNQTWMLKGDSGRPVAVVGLDDEWSGHIDADRAFRGIDPEMPVICLNHNPANCEELLAYPWQWMLSGHTHGRALATTGFGKRFYPHRFRHYVHGYYAVNGRHLYVNKGLSYGRRTMRGCRPEITVFKLEAE